MSSQISIEDIRIAAQVRVAELEGLIVAGGVYAVSFDTGLIGAGNANKANRRVADLEFWEHRTATVDFDRDRGGRGAWIVTLTAEDGEMRELRAIARAYHATVERIGSVPAVTHAHSDDKKRHVQSVAREHPMVTVAEFRELAGLSGAEMDIALNNRWIGHDSDRPGSLDGAHVIARD